jgi:O-acetyl-ADP-ribose deacetylase (regulator of RNase III)
VGFFGNDKNDLVSIISENVKKFGNKLNISFTVYNKEDVDFYQTAFSSILKD